MADRIELQRMYSSVFSHCLNVLSVAADVTEADKLFHIRAAATGKARSQTMERRVGGTTRAERWWVLIAVAVVYQELKQAAIRWRGMMMHDHGESDTQVEQACAQTAASSLKK